MKTEWRAKELLALVTSFIECAVVGGTIFGWASLVYILQEEGFYDYLCHDVLLETASNDDVTTTRRPNLTFQPMADDHTTWIPVQQTSYDNISVPYGDDHRTCLLQKQRLSLGYTIGMAVSGLSCFPFGLLFDKYGLRLTRTINVVAGLTGYILLAFASPTEYPWLIFPGAALVGMSTALLLMTCTHIARFARHRVFAVTSLYTGVAPAGVAFQVAKLGYDHGVSRTYTILAVGSVWFLVLFSTWVLLPKYKVLPAVLDTPASQRDTGPSSVSVITNYHNQQSATGEKGRHTEKDTTQKKEDHKQEVQSLRACVLSPLFICFLLWVVSLHVRVHMFVNVFTAWVTEVVHGDITRVSFYTDVLAYMFMASVITSPVAGVIVDYARNRLTDRNCGSEGDKTIAALPAVLLTTALAAGFSIAMLFYNDIAVYSAILVMTFSRSFLYSTAVNILSLGFPLDHYGSLFGLQYLAGGIGSATMYAYYAWAANNTRGFYTVHIFLLVTVFLSSSLAVMILYRFWRRRTTSDIIFNTRL